VGDPCELHGRTIASARCHGKGSFEAAFATLADKGASALIVSDDALFMNRRAVLVTLAASHAVPVIYGRREFAAAGGLISYGASTIRSILPVGRICRSVSQGREASRLPFLQPTKFESREAMGRAVERSDGTVSG
jgi:putative tryptophan/tyrosine transport system substrate-binding protein